MSKTSELDLCVKELRTAAQSLNAVADGLASLFSSKAETPEQPEPPKVIALEEVRAVLAEKSRNGYTAEVRELLKQHGADRLSEIDPKNYAALLADSEVLGNG